MEFEKRREFSLPPELVEHIQSFMKGKEAVRTAILSKSFYNAWSKRPNLDFDQRDFRYGFSEFTKKTMRRYEYLNQKIVCFTLWMKYDSGSPSLAEELIVRAMKLGVVDLNINFWSESKCLYLPDDVLRSETLVGLSVTGCRIDLGEVTCSKLKSLHLSRDVINGDLFRDLILRCPLIEKLTLGGRFCYFEYDHKLEFEFHKLQSLSLDTYSDRETLFYQDLLLKFPCLKNLSIRIIYDCRQIRICSQWVERISFIDVMVDYYREIDCYREVRAEFDVPNIRKFHFKGSAVYCLTFEKACGEDWDSDIHIMRYHASASRFSSLRKLLQNLSMSKVSLSIHVVKYPSNYICDYTRCESVPVVENLKIRAHIALSSGILDSLFLTCRPKLVNPNCCTPGGNKDLFELLCTKLVDRRSENHCIPNPSVHGLEEVIVEVFERSLAEWRPLPLKTVLDASACLENTKNFRFRLKWRP